jgi:hypothetical protein
VQKFFILSEPFLSDIVKTLAHSGNYILVVLPRGAIQEIKGKFIATVEIATKILDELPAGEVEYPWKTHSVLMSSVANSFHDNLA